MPDDDRKPPKQKRKRSLGRRLARPLLLSLGPLALAVVGAYWYATSGRYVSTENAYVKSDMIAVSADVAGHVEYVAVRENDLVQAGQILFRLDDARTTIALARRQAELESARQQVETLRALFRQKRAELEVAGHDVDFFKGEFDRTSNLQKKGHASQAKLQKARRDWLRAEQQVQAIREDIAGVLAGLGGDGDLPVDGHPLVLEAMAERDRVDLDLKRATVLTPRAGIVTKIELQPGEYVAAGVPVFSIVGVDRLWVEANLKETDLTHVREGQRALIFVDAYPDRTWQATVDSISPATGAEFSILPPQNASGNWVKVVQRIPVRLELERRSEEPPLRAGMSVRVEIDTRRERALPAFDSAFAWVRGQPQ